MDGDGDLDIVGAVWHEDTIAWYENNGAADPSWAAATIATSADQAHDVRIADMDGDGDLDIVSRRHHRLVREQRRGRSHLDRRRHRHQR